MFHRFVIDFFRSQRSAVWLECVLFLFDLLFVLGSPVSEQGQGVTGGLLLTRRDVRGPGSEC